MRASKINLFLEDNQQEIDEMITKKIEINISDTVAGSLMRLVCLNYK